MADMPPIAIPPPVPHDQQQAMSNVNLARAQAAARPQPGAPPPPSVSPFAILAQDAEHTLKATMVPSLGGIVLVVQSATGGVATTFVPQPV